MAGPDCDHRSAAQDSILSEPGDHSHPVLPEPLRNTLRDLIPLDASSRESFELRISEILIGYECSFLIQEMSGIPKDQKAKLAKLSTALGTAVDALLALPPDYNVAIGVLASRGTGRDSIDTVRLETEMALLRLGAQRLGLEVGIRWNKQKHKPPESGTPGAEAMVAVLRHTCPQPTVTAILNMIEKVQKHPLEDTPSPFDPVIRTHADELDASLLRDREKGNGSGFP